MSIKLKVTGSDTSTFSVNVANFNNPPSTCPISGVSTDLVDSSGDTVAYYSSTTLSGFTSGSITTASIIPNDP